MRHLARLLAEILRGQSPDVLLATPGYVSYLASTAPGYDPELLLSPRQVEIWEDLLGKLRTFELVQNLRRLLLRLRFPRESECRDGGNAESHKPDPHCVCLPFGGPDAAL